MKCPCQSCKHEGLDEKCAGCWLKWINWEPKENKRSFSEPIMDVLMHHMDTFLEDHDIWQLLELVVSAVATREQK